MSDRGVWNAGHVETEIEILQLERNAPGVELAPSLKRHDLPNGKPVYSVAEGRIVNLAARGGVGNPIEAMDLGLTLQARSLATLVDPGPATAPFVLRHHQRSSDHSCRGSRISSSTSSSRCLRAWRVVRPGGRSSTF